VLTLTAALSAGCTSSTSADPATTASAAPRVRADVESRVDTAIASLISHEGLSGTLLVAHAGTTVMNRSFGLADAASHTPNRIDTRFRIGSITKQFTAMAMLLLQEQGKLQVADPVCGYLASCPEQWRPVTIHHLLTHTSGIPNYTERPDVLPFNRAIAPVDLVAAMTTWPLDFPAGSRFSYSNSGYAILGHVIERVAHQRYADFLHAAILDPLALHNTGYDDRPTSPAHAIGYSTPDTPAEPMHASLAYAAGAMYSTVADLARWTQALIDRTFASRASVDAMLSPQVSWCDTDGTLCAPDACKSQPRSCASYGYGWELYSLQNRPGSISKIIEHGGGISGFRALSRYYPEQRLYLVLLMNAHRPDPAYVLRTVRDAATTR
jgi:CubicO group peptidase (beta-lactamase class C family)